MVVSVRNHFSYSMILIRLVGDNKVSKWTLVCADVAAFEISVYLKKKTKNQTRKRICSSVTCEGVTLCWTDCF